MKGLAIHRDLNEETRKQGVRIETKCGGNVFSLHLAGDEVVITDNSDYTKIYAIYSLDYFNEIYK
jgi:hypothetical protein